MPEVEAFEEDDGVPVVALMVLGIVVVAVAAGFLVDFAGGAVVGCDAVVTGFLDDVPLVVEAFLLRAAGEACSVAAGLMPAEVVVVFVAAVAGCIFVADVDAFSGLDEAWLVLAFGVVIVVGAADFVVDMVVSVGGEVVLVSDEAVVALDFLVDVVVGAVADTVVFVADRAGSGIVVSDDDGVVDFDMQVVVVVVSLVVLDGVASGSRTAFCFF